MKIYTRWWLCWCDFSFLVIKIQYNCTNTGAVRRRPVCTFCLYRKYNGHAKPEVVISPVVVQVDENFQRLYRCFQERSVYWRQNLCSSGRKCKTWQKRTTKKSWAWHYMIWLHSSLWRCRSIWASTDMSPSSARPVSTGYVNFFDLGVHSTWSQRPHSYIRSSRRALTTATQSWRVRRKRRPTKCNECWTPQPVWSAVPTSSTEACRDSSIPSYIGWMFLSESCTNSASWCSTACTVKHFSTSWNCASQSQVSHHDNISVPPPDSS